MLGIPLVLNGTIDSATGVHDLVACKAILEKFVAEVKVPSTIVACLLACLLSLYGVLMPLQQYQSLFFENTGGNAIYNPFLEEYVISYSACLLFVRVSLTTLLLLQ